MLTSMLHSKPRSLIGKDGITLGRSAGRLQSKPMKLHQILVQFESVDFWNPCHLQWLVVIKMAEIQPLESVSFPMEGFWYIFSMTEPHLHLSKFWEDSLLYPWHCDQVMWDFSQVGYHVKVRYEPRIPSIANVSPWFGMTSVPPWSCNYPPQD